MRDERRFAQLTAEKRWKLHELRGAGRSMRECARALGVDASTISRELRRNRADVTGGSLYLPDHAELCYRGRRKRCHPHIKMNDPVFRSYMVRLIMRGWSPERIAGHLERVHGHKVVSHEALYQFIYGHEIGRRDRMYEYLPRGKKRRTKRKGRRAHKHRLEGRVFIDERPKEIEERSSVGHWETDSLLCKRREGVNVLVERASRKVVITKLAAKDAPATTSAITTRLEKEIALSITADNGPENAEHKKIARTLSTSFFFCHPYHSWEKGTVENRNGIIRRFLPRSTDLAEWTQNELDEIAEDINTTPMKCLGYRTPNEVYSKCCI